MDGSIDWLIDWLTAWLRYVNSNVFTYYLYIYMNACACVHVVNGEDQSCMSNIYININIYT